MIYLINRVLMALIEISAAAVVLVPIYVVWNKTGLHSSGKSVLYCIFSLYLAAVCALVGMPNVTYVRFECNVNLLPIAGMMEDWKNSILNVFLFIPLGLMLPVLWGKYREGKKTILIGFGMSLSIEVLQLFTFRATDVNDLLTNGLGTGLGFLCSHALLKKFPAFKNLVKEGKNSELFGVLAIVFGVMFFIQPFISAFLWELLT